MPSDPHAPHPCSGCGHPVYRPLLLPIGRPQESCRAVVATTPVRGRCGCANAVHRLVATPAPPEA